MIERSETIKAIIGALHKAQGEISGVVKDSKNPHYKNSYASLAAVVEAAKEPLQANGLCFMQALGEIVDDRLQVTTMLMHISGEWMASTLHIPLTKKDAQGVGSASTYGQRYALMAMLGLPPVDDDGEAARPKDKPVSDAPIGPEPQVIQKFPTNASKEAADGIIADFRLAADIGALLAIRGDAMFRADWMRLLKTDQERVTEAYGDRKAALEGA